MNFWAALRNSVYNPLFYAGLPASPLRRSFRYFFILSAVLAFLLAFVFGAEISPIFSAARMSALSERYPSELIIQGSSGVISASIAQPYFIKVAPGTIQNARSNIAVIDTTRDFSLDRFRQYDSAFWIGRDFLAAAKNQNQVQVTELGRVPDFYVDQARVKGWADWVAGHHLAFSLILFALLFVCFVAFFTVKLLWLVIMALIIMLLVRLRRSRLSFRHSYQAALHAATLPLILQMFFIVSGVFSPFIFFYSLIFLIVVLVNVGI